MDKECFICGTTINVENHHVFYGRGLRQLSDKYGTTVYLCHRHHRGNKGVHFNKELDNYLKSLFQQRFEENHSRKEFMEIFGRNYL